MAETISNQYFSVLEASALGDRKQQQDAHSVRFTRRKMVHNQPVLIAVVADGMGGQEQTKGIFKKTGRDASRLAVKTFMQIIGDLRETKGATQSLMQKKIAEAGSTIFNRFNRNSSGREVVGTTIATAVVKITSDPEVYHARYDAIGDSPVFRITHGTYGTTNILERLTVDEHAGRKNVLSNALGISPTTTISSVNIGETVLSRGDELLLATDGVVAAEYEAGQQQYHGLEDFLKQPENWRKITVSENPFLPFSRRRVLSAEKLVREATKLRIAGRRRDNATAVVIRVK